MGRKRGGGSKAQQPSPQNMSTTNPDSGDVPAAEAASWQVSERGNIRASAYAAEIDSACGSPLHKACDNKERTDGASCMQTASGAQQAAGNKPGSPLATAAACSLDECKGVPEGAPQARADTGADSPQPRFQGFWETQPPELLLLARRPCNNILALTHDCVCYQVPRAVAWAEYMQLREHMLLCIMLPQLMWFHQQVELQQQQLAAGGAYEVL